MPDSLQLVCEKWGSLYHFFFFNTFPLFLVITFADTSLKSILSRKEKNRDSFLFLYGDLFKLYTMTQTREKSAKKKKKQNPQ